MCRGLLVLSRPRGNSSAGAFNPDCGCIQRCRHSSECARAKGGSCVRDSPRRKTLTLFFSDIAPMPAGTSCSDVRSNCGPDRTTTDGDEYGTTAQVCIADSDIDGVGHLRSCADDACASEREDGADRSYEPAAARHNIQECVCGDDKKRRRRRSDSRSDSAAARGSESAEGQTEEGLHQEGAGQRPVIVKGRSKADLHGADANPVTLDPGA